MVERDDVAPFTLSRRDRPAELGKDEQFIGRADGERRAPAFRLVAYATPRGCAAAYFPETNVLVPLDSTADTSNTPTSRLIEKRNGPTVIADCR